MSIPGDDDPDLFGWSSRDRFSNRKDGQDSVFNHTPMNYQHAYFNAVRRLLQQGCRELTSEEVRDLAGMPPNHPSAVGALMAAAAKHFNLRKVGTRQAVGRHQHILTVWGLR